jgi:XTP/dITP diphosphohydrolase
VSPLPGKIVMASSNPGKLRELSRLLDGLGVVIVPQSDYGVEDAEENGTTFRENSYIKARHAAAATGLPAIADDSGLVVDALEGRPGVYSARYAGPGATDRDNVARLLAEMASVPDDARGAAFHCVATFVVPGDEKPLVAEGVWRGSILRAPRGEGGFGYDPVFLDPDSGKTGAELDRDAKNARSHRGQALRHLVERLQQRYP